MEGILMKKLARKIIVDMSLAILSLALMMFKVTGVFAHELMGIAWIAVTGVHLFLNRNWLMGLFRKNADCTKPKRKKSQLVWNSILSISTVLLVVSGLAISEVIFSFGASGAFLAVHSIASKLFMLSCIAHVVLHRQYLKAAFGKMFGAKKRTKSAPATSL